MRGRGDSESGVGQDREDGQTDKKMNGNLQLMGMGRWESAGIREIHKFQWGNLSYDSLYWGYGT